MRARPLPDAAVDAAAGARQLVLLLDVDGTLAPIAPRPEDAHVPPATRSAIARLVGRPGTILSVVSGRAARNAHAMVGLDGIWAIGNHGAERLTPDDRLDVDPRVAAYEPALASTGAQLREALATFSGVRVEDKHWSLSVHYRQVARDAVPDLVATARAIIERHGLRAHDAKEVVEARAPVDVTKGTAVVDLLGHLGVDPDEACVVYIGDDATDEDAFRSLRLAVRHAVTVHVGRDDVETVAEYGVPNPDAVRGVLERIAGDVP